MTKPFDPTKPVQTRDGRPARIICCDRKHHNNHIVALVSGRDGAEQVYKYPASGLIYEVYTGRQHNDDLINVPTKVVRVSFHNVYSETIGTPWDSLESANNSSIRNRIGVLKMTYYEDGTFDHEKVSDAKA